jgi:pimeloyl-ACP methyl ester carboxylesterase
MRRLLALAAALAVAAPAVTSATAAADAASIADAPVRTAKAGQGRIGYRSVGKGFPVVLVMGLSGTMDAWAPDFADRLAASGHRVITFDNEGIGRTTLGRGELTIKRMSDDTASLIRALKLRRADVLGWSMGGMIAQATAIRHPKQVRRLVLAATAPGDGKGIAPAADVLTALSGAGASSGTAGAAAGLLGLLFPADQQAAQNAYVGEIVRYRGFRAGAPATVTRAQLGASAAWMMGRDPASASPARIRQRVLVGGGADDHVLPIANDQHIAAAAPHATLKVYADAAHGFLFQEQDDFLPAIAAFLR